MAGYSGTPLPKKLGIRPGLRVLLVGVPAEVRAMLRDPLAQCDRVHGRADRVDLAMVFARSRAELEREFGPASVMLAETGMLWACWPKKSSGVVTDVDENTVREIGLGGGLVDVKVCAVTSTWSGLKFVRRRADRGGLVEGPPSTALARSP
jgi:hypothetical protein